MTLFNHQEFVANDPAELQRERRYRVFAGPEREMQSAIRANDHRSARRIGVARWRWPFPG